MKSRATTTDITTEERALDRRGALQRLGLGMSAVYAAPFVLSLATKQAVASPGGGDSGGDGGGESRMGNFGDLPNRHGAFSPNPSVADNEGAPLACGCSN